jgi:phytoene/squalene synthetase
MDCRIFSFLYRVAVMNHDLTTLSRHADYDSHLIAGMAAAPLRDELHLINALRDELIRAVKLNSEPTLAAIRLKWWEESIAAACNPPHHQNHPLLLALEESDLKAGSFASWFDARATEIETRQGMESSADFYRYLDADFGSWFTLITRLHHAEPDASVAALARAYGITSLLRQLPAHIQESRILWPKEMLLQCGLNPAATEREDVSERLQQFVRERAEEATTLLLQSSPAHLPVKPLHHYALVTQLWLNKLQQKRYQITRLSPRLPTLPLRLALGR